MPIYRECLTYDPLNAKINSHLLYKIALCQDNLDEPEEALKELGEALKYRPRYPKALVKRGEVHMALKKYE